LESSKGWEFGDTVLFILEQGTLANSKQKCLLNRARVAARVKEALENMSLDQLRAARELTQGTRPPCFGIKQASIPKWNGAPTCTSARIQGSLRLWVGNWKSAPVFRTDPCASQFSEKTPDDATA
jgi:hypothetical protein